MSLSVTTDFIFDLKLGLDFTQALGLAGVLSLSSLGVVAKVLIDAGCLKEPVGVQIFTAVIIAELIALFVVGFAISEHFYAGGHGHSLNPLDVAVLVGQIVGFTVATWFFVPLFFASAGLHLSLEFLKLPPETILALVLVPLAGKFAGAFISAFITRLDAPLATAAGLMAKGVAEIALLLLLLHTGAIDKGVFSLLVLVMFGYILLTPMGITFALRRLKHAEAVTSDDQTPPLLDRFALEGIRVKDILDRSRSHPEQSLTVKALCRAVASAGTARLCGRGARQVGGNSVAEHAALSSPKRMGAHSSQQGRAPGWAVCLP